MEQTRDISGEATLKEQPDASSTHYERPGAPDPDAALKLEPAETPGPSHQPIQPFGLETFRNWPILEQLPTQGAEADIYIV